MNDDDARIKFRHQALLKLSQVDPDIISDLKTQSSLPLESETELQASPIEILNYEEPTDHKISRLLEEGYKTDKWWQKIEQEMTKPESIPRSKDVSLAECEIRDARLYFRGRL